MIYVAIETFIDHDNSKYSYQVDMSAFIHRIHRERAPLVVHPQEWEITWQTFI